MEMYMLLKVTPVKSEGRETGQREELNCDATQASAYLMGSSAVEKALQRYPQSRQRGQAFLLAPH